MCATVDTQCLEYFGCITLPLTCLFEINIAARNESFFQVFQSCFLRERTYQKQFVIFIYSPIAKAMIILLTKVK